MADVRFISFQKQLICVIDRMSMRTNKGAAKIIVPGGQVAEEKRKTKVLTDRAAFTDAATKTVNTITASKHSRTGS